MDVESKDDNKFMAATAHHDHNHDTVSRGRRGTKKICLWSIAVVVTLAILFIILGFTVFKAKKPVVTVNSASVEDLDFSFDIARLRVHLNLTINATVTVKNPNRVGFKYSSSSALLKYRDQVVGEAPIPAGEIASHATSLMNVSLTLMADRLLSDPNLLSDAASGTLPFTTFVQLSGKVKILFDIKIKSTTTCDLDIDLLNRSVSRQSCHYKTEL